MRQFYFPLLVIAFATQALAVEPPNPAPVKASNRPSVPVRIQVVKTWQDLLDQPTIPLEKGEARLGIESHRGRVNSGVLLYCLTSGFEPPQKWRRSNRLGPFIVEAQLKDGPRVEADRIAAAASSPHRGPRALLFRQVIPIGQAGRISVSIKRLQGAEVAHTEIKGKDDAFHAWMTFERSLAQSSLEPRDPAFDAVGRVANRTRGAAIPSFGGMLPIAAPIVLGENGNLTMTPENNVKTRLPGLVPIARRLKVRPHGSGLLLESQEEIILARPDWHYLVRWWINGKPFSPKPMKSFADQNGIVIVGKKLLLQVEFDAEGMGVKSGDTVEAQLMYCQAGWQIVRPEIEMLTPHSEMGGPELVLSNRVELHWESQRKSGR